MDNLEQHFTSIFLVINIPFCQVFSRYTLSTNVLNLFLVGRKNHLKLIPNISYLFTREELWCFRKLSASQMREVKRQNATEESAAASDTESGPFHVQWLRNLKSFNSPSEVSSFNRETAERNDYYTVNGWIFYPSKLIRESGRRWLEGENRRGEGRDEVEREIHRFVKFVIKRNCFQWKDYLAHRVSGYCWTSKCLCGRRRMWWCDRGDVVMWQ